MFGFRVSRHPGRADAGEEASELVIVAVWPYSSVSMYGIFLVYCGIAVSVGAS